ncbi:MAG: hypothetical protein CMQ55_01250 [Gammaproteobacteria bacterium]|nr:hypothetical protein [Gammaproteobacteria bacterium]
MKIIVPLLVIIFFLIRHLIKPKKVNRITRNDMDSCISCGTFVSKDLAVKKGKNTYCSEKCIK